MPPGACQMVGMAQVGCDRKAGCRAWIGGYHWISAQVGGANWWDLKARSAAGRAREEQRARPRVQGSAAGRAAASARVRRRRRPLPRHMRHPPRLHAVLCCPVQAIMHEVSHHMNLDHAGAWRDGLFQE